jgi:hypothetical protein
MNYADAGSGHHVLTQRMETGKGAATRTMTGKDAGRHREEETSINPVVAGVPAGRFSPRKLILQFIINKEILNA